MRNQPKLPEYDKAHITGGIPPDEDHKLLFKCCWDTCKTTQDNEPLVVVAVNSKMATFCRTHYDYLTRHSGPRYDF